MIRFSIIILLMSALQAQDKGRKAYESGKYDEARAYYEHVLNNRKNDAAAQFGLGATAYKQQDMEIATRSLNAVKNSDDPSLAAKALYNLGNMFRDQQKMAESLAMYRKALELDPMDEDAKINYELLKQVIEQQQTEEQEQQQDQNSDQKKEDDGQNQASQDQQQDNKEDQKQNHPNQENQKQSEKPAQQEQSQVEQEASQGKKSDKQMQAEAILNALKDQEKINQKRQIAKSKSRKMEKDW
ncbi:MAG: tetratricopeptide repeat protein [Candidatus Neomarinimicrobiota bacterium]|nr:tetratricopeptide repeat protein [Candidatus Neomarinimicrobiota bacterium]